MKITATNMRDVRWDCPWEGHLLGDRLIIRNATMPNLIGLQCVKCGALIYEVMEMSQVVGADGAPLPKA